MPFYDLSHINDSNLLQGGLLTASRERGESATLLAYIAEIDSRGLFVTAGFSSMFAYCLKEYRLSEDAANARIQVARTARKYPFLFDALQDGRLHLTAVRLLAPHLTSVNASELAAAATNRTMTEIQRMIAQRFPLEEPPKATQTIRAIPSGKVGVPVSRRIDPLFQGLNGSNGASAAANVAPASTEPDVSASSAVVHARSSSVPPDGAQPVPGAPPSDQPMAPLKPAAMPAIPSAHPAHFAPERYLVRFTISRGIHDKLRYAQMLASHSNPGGSIERIMDEALDLFIAQREKQKFAATNRPRPRWNSTAVVPAGPRPGARSADAGAAAPSAGHPNGRPNTHGPSPSGASRRYIPAEVKRAVWKRDQGRCTFVSASGHRCESSDFLEFDHVDPVARGGTSTVERVRLRCRAHNQYEAERAFGPEFMRVKREQARAAREREGERPGPAAPVEPDPDPEAPPD